MKPTRFVVQAKQEFAEAAVWYESNQPGLANRFLEEIEQQLALIREHPAVFPILRDVPRELEVRRSLLRRFPYGLIFVELDDEIQILALAHNRRQPGYWLDRLEA